MKTCPICGKKFTPLAATKQKYCSAECACKGHQARKNERRRADRAGIPRDKRQVHEYCGNDPDSEQTKVRVAGLAGYYAANAECVSRKLQIEPWDVWHLPCAIVDRTLDGNPLFEWMKKKINSVQNSILVRHGYQKPKQVNTERGPRVGLQRNQK